MAPLSTSQVYFPVNTPKTSDNALLRGKFIFAKLWIPKGGSKNEEAIPIRHLFCNEFIYGTWCFGKWFDEYRQCKGSI